MDSQQFNWIESVDNMNITENVLFNNLRAVNEYL